jgi:3-hydroxyacyl-CoA dehydrogenase
MENGVLVVGTGLMGSEIAQVCAQSWFETYAFVISKEASEKS